MARIGWGADCPLLGVKQGKLPEPRLRLVASCPGSSENEDRRQQTTLKPTDITRNHQCNNQLKDYIDRRITTELAINQHRNDPSYCHSRR